MGLKNVDLPKLTALSGSEFATCEALERITLPSVVDMPTGGTFMGCISLRYVDFPKIVRITNNAFNKCGALTVLILRVNQVVQVAGSTTFTNSGLVNGAGYIYVPAAQIEAYRADSSWSTYGVQFRALEEYTLDGTTTGALDEVKIGA